MEIGYVTVAELMDTVGHVNRYKKFWDEYKTKVPHKILPLIY